MPENSTENGADRDTRITWWRRLVTMLTGEPQDREDLVELLRDAQKRELFDADAQAMIEGVLQVSDMQVRDIMLPRTQMTVIERDAVPEEIVPLIIDSGHSRFPVIGDDRDQVVGIILAKDLLRYYAAQPRTAFEIREYLRPAVFIPESKRLNVLLKEFRASRNHIAIVVDEYGAAAGLVTIEDVLEQIVGEIDDEHDAADEAWVLPRSERSFTVKALTLIEDFNEYFGTAFDDEEFDTVGGMVMHAFGHMPKRNETVSIGRFSFKVLNADNRRVHLLQLELAPEPEDGTED